MRLSAYIDEHPITIPELASKVGVSRQALWRYANGDRLPRADIMRAIMEATGGKVTPADFYNVPVDQPAA